MGQWVEGANTAGAIQVMSRIAVTLNSQIVKLQVGGGGKTRT